MFHITHENVVIDRCLYKKNLYYFLVYIFHHDFRHHQHGRWQARIGRVAGNKDLYLGTFSK
jgi:hypothetical protein